LNEYLNYPTCEGDFLNEFTVEKVLECVRKIQRDNGNNNGRNKQGKNGHNQKSKLLIKWAKMGAPFLSEGIAPFFPQMI
jgi:hypothetical protein